MIENKDRQHSITATPSGDMVFEKDTGSSNFLKIRDFFKHSKMKRNKITDYISIKNGIHKFQEFREKKIKHL